MDIMVSLAIGFLFGAFFGLFLMALLVSAKQEDEFLSQLGGVADESNDKGRND